MSKILLLHEFIYRSGIKLVVHIVTFQLLTLIVLTIEWPTLQISQENVIIKM